MKRKNKIKSTVNDLDINRRKLPATEAIKHNGSPCLSPESLWDALHNTFNTTLHCQVDFNILNEIDCKPTLQ